MAMQLNKGKFLTLQLCSLYIVILLGIIAWADNAPSEPLQRELSSYFSDDYQEARNKPSQMGQTGSGHANQLI
jgi:hypothetical protein